MPDLILAIETSNPTAHPGAAGVALAKRGADGSVEVVCEEAVREGPRLDDDLAPAIERVCARMGVGPADLAGVAVSVGPGGYTSIRVGVACAAMIGRARGVGVAAVPSALAAAVLASREVGRGIALSVCLAWKGDTVWRHRFTSGDRPVALDAGRLVRMEDLDRGEVVVADGAMTDRLGAGGQGPGMRVVPVRMSGGAVAIASVMVDAMDPSGVTAIYPREPEAITKWRALRSRG